jgi:hypothetical protein
MNPVTEEIESIEADELHGHKAWSKVSVLVHIALATVYPMYLSAPIELLNVLDNEEITYQYLSYIKLFSSEPTREREIYHNYTAFLNSIVHLNMTNSNEGVPKAVTKLMREVTQNRYALAAFDSIQQYTQPMMKHYWKRLFLFQNMDVPRTVLSLMTKFHSHYAISSDETVFNLFVAMLESIGYHYFRSNMELVRSVLNDELALYSNTGDVDRSKRLFNYILEDYELLKSDALRSVLKDIVELHVLEDDLSSIHSMLHTLFHKRIAEDVLSEYYVLEIILPQFAEYVLPTALDRVPKIPVGIDEVQIFTDIASYIHSSSCSWGTYNKFMERYASTIESIFDNGNNIHRLTLLQGGYTEYISPVWMSELLDSIVYVPYAEYIYAVEFLLDYCIENTLHRNSVGLFVVCRRSFRMIEDKILVKRLAAKIGTRLNL